MTAISTDTEISPLARPDNLRARRAFVPAAVGTAVLILFFETMRADSLGEAIAMDAFGVVCTALVYGLVVRTGLRHEAVPVRAVVMSVLGLLLAFPAFWSGLPLVLGGAGALLGYAGKRASARSGSCIAAFVVGALAVIAYLAIYVGDWIANPGASLWS
jgi:tellurite resistance protein TehA-like permease